MTLLLSLALRRTGGSVVKHVHALVELYTNSHHLY